MRILSQVVLRIEKGARIETLPPAPQQEVTDGINRFSIVSELVDIVFAIEKERGPDN